MEKKKKMLKMFINLLYFPNYKSHFFFMVWLLI